MKIHAIQRVLLVTILVGSRLTSSAIVDAGNSQVLSIGHTFHAPLGSPPGTPHPVADYLVDQDQSSGGGAMLSSVSTNFAGENQFSVTVSAPSGTRIRILPPPGQPVRFGGKLRWHWFGSTGNTGDVAVTFSGLQGTSPDFSVTKATLAGDGTFGAFGFDVIQSTPFTNELSFTSMTLTATVTNPAASGALTYYPAEDSLLNVWYETTQTSDPGGFIELVTDGTTTNCSVTVLPTSRELSNWRQGGRVSVVADPGCPWSVFNSNDWVNVTSWPNQIANGTVTYVVSSNDTGVARNGFIQIGDKTFEISQSAEPPAPLPPVDLGNVQVSTLGHGFHTMSPLPGVTHNTVLDYLVDHDQNSGGGGVLQPISANWDTNNEFALTVSAPEGHKFLVEPPPGFQVRFGGYLWWDRLGGESGPGAVTVTFAGLEGAAPNFEESDAVLSDTHGFMGFFDIVSSPFSNTLAFTSMTIRGITVPQQSGLGTLNFTPHNESWLGLSYNPTVTSDPGSFVSIVPQNQLTGATPDLPPLKVVRGPNNEMGLVFDGTLESRNGEAQSFNEVTGNPKGLYVVPDSSQSSQFFRVKRE